MAGDLLSPGAAADPGDPGAACGPANPAQPPAPAPDSPLPPDADGDHDAGLWRGVQFEVDLGNQADDGPPSVELRLARSRYPVASDAPFAPKRLPERIELRLGDLNARRLMEGRVRFTARLAEGEHGIPLSGGHPLALQIAEGTRATGVVQVGQRAGGHPDEAPLLERLELAFDPPLQIGNVLHVLVEVQHLFEDGRVAALLARLPSKHNLDRLRSVGNRALGIGGRAAASLRDRLRRRLKGHLPEGLSERVSELGTKVGQALSAAPAEAGVVLLSRVSALPRFKALRDQWELELRFTGQVRWLDRVPQPFNDVLLPASVVPAPHAALDRLLSAGPLASGTFRSDRFLHHAFVQAALDALLGFEGQAEAEVELPRLVFRGEAVDRTRFAAQLTLPPRCRVASAISVTPLHAQAADAPEGAEATGATDVGEATGAPEVAEAAAADAREDPPAPTGPTQQRRFGLHVGPATVSFPGLPGGELRAEIHGQAEVDLAATDRPLPERIRSRAELRLLEGSKLPRAAFELSADHPLAVGGAEVQVVVTDLAVEGSGVGLWGGQRIRFAPAGGGLCFSGELAMPEQTLVRRSRSELRGELHGGRVAGSLVPLPGAPGRWRWSVRAEASLQQRLLAEVSPVPELGLDDARLVASVRSSLRASGEGSIGFAGAQLPELHFGAGGRVELELHDAVAELAGRRVTLPTGTRLSGTVQRGQLGFHGSSEFVLDLGWDLGGRPCLLHGPGRTVSLLTDALRQGELTLHLNPAGRFSFSGLRRGLYGVRFFNALLDPASEPAHLVDVLRSDDVLEHVIAAVEILSPELAERLDDLRDLVLGVRAIAAREGIERPGDVVPRDRIARLLSLLAVGSDALQRDLEPLIQSVSEGRGLDIDRAKELLRPCLASFQVDYELDGLLRWIDLVTRPSEALPPPEPVDQLPRVEDPRWEAARAGLPSAAQLLAVAVGRDEDRAVLEHAVQLAPELTLPQLDLLAEGAGQRLPPELRARLGYVRELKRRVARIEEGYGGIAYAAQVSTIAGFLGEAVGPLPGIDPPADVASAPVWPPPCALGAREVAVLLQAGLAAGRQGLQTQLHNRMLLEHVRAQGGDYLVQVLSEMGHHTSRALTGVLFSFLHQDQDEMRQPLDLVAYLEEGLGLPVPLHGDYMAGGRRARDSYYAALAELAERVFELSGPHLARGAHLQCVRHPVPDAPSESGALAELYAEAVARISEADAAGARCSFRTSRGGAAAGRASSAYEVAFGAVRRLIGVDPCAFQLPGVRDFWRRNEEALRVLSVVRNYQHDVDRVRRWLEITGGRKPARGEQRLLEAAVRTLYAYPQHQDELLADPLVRLLIDPKPGRYAFTIVTAMGVVTDGADGHELEDSFARLKEQRGVHVVRARTGLVRSLGHNAERLIEAVQTVEGPWGYIGYSQGCANALLAESTLRQGTPAQQALLDRLVARNLLYGATNGSAHGTSGSLKFLRAMIEGERFLKHYQASTSREAVEIVFRGLKAALDSSFFVKTLGGTESLTLRRALLLHRDGQFVPWAATSTTRGVVGPATLPESLEYLHYVHGRLTPGRDADSQVAVDEAVGHATRVRNAHTAVLARCDTGSYPHSTHHWAPLSVEIDMLRTDRDQARAVFDSPKDRHVFPWVEVNARFGRIPRVG